MSPEPSHVNSLPPELLGKIFTLALPSEDPDRLNPANPPSLLTQVCGHWRQTAIAEHNLWDTIIFPPFPRIDDDDASYTLYARFIASGGVDLWFSRTGDSRALTLGQASDPECARPNTMSPLLTEIMLKYTRRLKSLAVVIALPKELDSVYRKYPPAQGAPLNLKTLSIVTKTSVNVIPTTRRALEGIPWAHLTTLTLESSHKGGPTSKEWESLWKLCISVTRGTFTKPDSRSTWRPLPGQSPIPFHHTALKHLTLTVLPRLGEFDAPKLRWKFFGWPVTFPNLEDLHVNAPPTCWSADSIIEDAPALSSLKRLTIAGSKLGIESGVREIYHVLATLHDKPDYFSALEQITAPFPLALSWPWQTRMLANVLLTRPKLRMGLVVGSDINLWKRKILRIWGCGYRSRLSLISVHDGTVWSTGEGSDEDDGTSLDHENMVDLAELPFTRC